MLTSVEGIYRNGRIELTEQPTDAYEGSRVIVTFVRSDATISNSTLYGISALLIEIGRNKIRSLCRLKRAKAVCISEKRSNDAAQKIRT
jgi:hypothetical protein